jgi:hypothetical protein
MSSVRQSAGIKGAGGKGIGGQFKAHEASEPGFSLESTGLSRHEPGPSPEVSRAAAVRSRKQAAAAASLLEAYPDVVAARFVDIGSMYLEAPNGMRMANPDYDPQPGSTSHTFRRFELRNVLLSDGSIADKDNQPQFTDRFDVERLADSMQGHADMVFDAEPDPYEHAPYEEALYKDHVHNQHVYFHQLVKDAAPRELRIDQWGEYFDTDNDRIVSDPTDEEKAALGDRTPESAARELADELIKNFGRKRAMEMATGFVPGGPAGQRSKRLQEALENSPRFSWNPFRRR